ncbi:MAG: nucleotidyl transferase AbiEii/AbiGii toxin family protein [Bradymonadales bacterium]|nr:MAG: nucleotidyl transferase AbiEii/AbiGii toxin family protein [Bradymonadales bacterium]
MDRAKQETRAGEPWMTRIKEYKIASAFRSAIEDRLKTISEKEKVDIQRLRRQFAFDRLLARLFRGGSPPWILKGGYAMQLRTTQSRTTKDIDLAIQETKLFSGDSEHQLLLEKLRDKAEVDLKDFCLFQITGPIMDLDAAPYGGARFHINLILDDRSFEKFHLDIGIGDAVIEPLDELTPRNWLDFAGFESQKYPSLSKEQQLAEKIHAYTLPRSSDRENSRVKDLIDMLLFIELNSLNLKFLKTAIDETFKQRETHNFKPELPQPPASWARPFAKLAKECSLTTDLEKAYEIVRTYVLRLNL